MSCEKNSNFDSFEENPIKEIARQLAKDVVKIMEEFKAKTVEEDWCIASYVPGSKRTVIIIGNESYCRGYRDAIHWFISGISNITDTSEWYKVERITETNLL